MNVFPCCSQVVFQNSSEKRKKAFKLCLFFDSFAVDQNIEMQVYAGFAFRMLIVYSHHSVPCSIDVDTTENEWLVYINGPIGFFFFNSTRYLAFEPDAVLRIFYAPWYSSACSTE